MNLLSKSWILPTGNLNLEVPLSSIEPKLFKDKEIPSTYFNLSSNKQRAMRSLADDGNIVIKKVGICSAVGVQDSPKETKG